MEKEENITKILLLGETGVGKSSFGNYIIGKKKFLTDGGASSTTKIIDGKISERELYKDIYIIDSPGTEDSKGNDEYFLEELKNSFQDINAGVKVICLLINFSQPKFPLYLQKQIRTYCLLFPIKDFWDHASIIFTKSYYYIPENKFNKIKSELESENGLINQIIKYIKECTKAINEERKNDNNFEEIRIPNKLPAYYIDSDLEATEEDNIRTEEEIKKLIEWARTKDYLDVENINKNHIDVNYLNTKKLEDIVIEEEKILDSKNNLKIYSKKFYAQYEKTTFHNQTIVIKDSSPYKVEEIKEEEKEGPKILIYSGNDYKKYEIQHKAVPSKKRIIENGESEWEDIQNPPDIKLCRNLYIDEVIEKFIYDKKLITEYLEGEKHIEKYNYYKITKTFINGIEQKDKEIKELIYEEQRIKEILKKLTEKKPYKDNIQYLEEIEIEKILIETKNGLNIKTQNEEKIINKKKKYYKALIIDGDEYEEKIGHIINRKVIEYKKEDEVDINGNIILEGIKEKIGDRIIGTWEERHLIRTEIQPQFETFEEYEYRKQEINNENNAAKVSNQVGLGTLIGGSILSFIFPPLGIPLAISGGITSGVSQNFEHQKFIKNQKRKITKIKEFSIKYNIFSDGTREQISRTFVKEECFYGNWEDC